MTRHDLDATTRTALVDLDPGRGLVVDDTARRRADAALARVLATDPAARATDRAEPPVGRRRVRRVATVAVAGLVAVAVTVLVPGVTRTESARASWTPRPVQMSPGDVRSARDACVELIGPPDAPGAAGSGSFGSGLADSRVVAADRRGSWRFVVLSDGSGFDGWCLLQDPTLVQRVIGLASGAGIAGAGAGPAVTPVARDVVVSTSGSGSVDDQAYGAVAGLAGRDVRQVVVTSPDGLRSTASLGDGHFAAWWPQRSAGLDEVRLTVTLVDGTVLPSRTLEQIASNAPQG